MSKEDNNKKRNLKRKSIGASSVLVQLYNNRKLVTKVDNMLDEGQTYDYIVEFCKSESLGISKSTLTNYKQKREESIETGVPLVQLLDKRVKDNVTYITDKVADSIITQDFDEPKGGNGGGNPPTNMDRVENVYNDLELLDEIIAKGAKGLSMFDVVDTPLAMKAIELKAKITNNQLSGLSIAGLREIKLRQRAREAALMEVIAQFVSEDKQEEVLDALDQAEHDFYENLDLTEEDRRITSALEKSGIDL